MACQLVRHNYGKSRVRISRITRRDDRHDFIEVTAAISLEGEFDAAYTQDDNHAVIPTDTMKNTAYALAHDHGIPSLESFALCLGQHFLDEYAHVIKASIALEEHPWVRLKTGEKEQPISFVSAGGELSRCRADCTRQAVHLESGLTGLQVLKTTESGFRDFHQDRYTTLPETDDRIFATTIEASWPCKYFHADWGQARRAIRAALLQVFAEQYSPSVQATLYRMATTAFEHCEAIDEISITMPNQHHLLANLEPLDITNRNVTFVPSSEPFGLISATVRRGETRSTETT